MFAKILSSKTKTVGWSAFFVAIAGFLGYFLSIFRDNLLANFLTNQQADVYWAAFRIPDFVYGILITGGVSAAFLPVFAGVFHKEETKAKALFNTAFTFFLFSLIILSALMAIFAPLIVDIIVPGFDAIKKQQTVQLARIMFLSPIILGVSAVFASVLQCFDYFIAFAIAPIFYNLGIICGIVFLTPAIGISGLAWGVVLGAVMHFLIQTIPLFKSNFLPHLSFNFKLPELKNVLKLMGPRVIGTAANNIKLIVNTALASTLLAGSIKIFNLSNNLNNVPVNLIGVSLAVAVFPLLSRYQALQENKKFTLSVSHIFSRIVFLIAPITVLIFLLRAQIVRLLYGVRLSGVSHFGWWETRLTASSLGILALSLFALCLCPLLIRAFFALRDTKTPVKIALITIAFNIVLAYILIKALHFANFFSHFTANILHLNDVSNLAVLALPLALSASNVLQFCLLVFYLKRKKEFVQSRLLAKFFLGKILFASLLMGIACFFTLRLAVRLSGIETIKGLALQVFLAGFVSLLVYTASVLKLGVKEPKNILKVFYGKLKHS